MQWIRYGIHLFLDVQVLFDVSGDFDPCPTCGASLFFGFTLLVNFLVQGLIVRAVAEIVQYKREPPLRTVATWLSVVDQTGLTA